MERTSRTQLTNLLRQLAAVTNSPMGEVWTKRPDGTNKATVGALELDQIHMGYQVQQIHNEAGGVTTPLGDYRRSAGDMRHVLKAAIDGIRMVLGEDEFHTRMRRAYPDTKAA